MLNFNYKEYQENLKLSEKITDCDRVPVPGCAEHQNYIFVSYSHKDYKKVYHDLAAMYAAGVRFWYDEELTAGFDWDAEVCKKLSDPHCSGVIFYLSENFFASESIYKEILTTLGKNAKLSTSSEPKNFFCVNLSEKMPSVLIEEADVHSEECESFFENTDETLKDFLLNAFRDKATYLPFGSRGYAEKLLVQIRRNFNVIDLTGDDASLIGEYNGEMLNGKRNGYGVCKYENGNVYLGEWKDNKYQGKGKLIYSEGDSRDYLEGVFSEHKANGACILKFKNGDCYDGNMTDGKLTGFFTYTQNDGYVYEGEMLSGEKNGKGKLIYPQDNEIDYYDGEWLNNNRHGHGVLMYKDQTCWEGAWKQDKKQDGYGYIKYSNGRVYCGEMKDGKLEGKGKITYSEKEMWEYYDGEWKDGGFGGNGILKYRNGSSYNGGWQKNTFHGKGKLVYTPDSHIEYYDGDYESGVKKGFGTMKFKDGNSYSGEWNNDKFNGNGRYDYKSESHIEFFEGRYEDDKKNGRGIMRFKNGEMYDGEWKDDKYSGVGIFRYTEEDIREYYDGLWLNNKYHGKGTLLYSDGTKWEGEWNNGNQHNGNGTIKYNNESVFCGEIKDGKYNNKGKLTYQPSSKIEYYEGDWIEGKQTGVGFMKFKSGDTYEGEWKDDKYHGVGKNAQTNGAVYEGEWICNKRNGKGKYTFPEGKAEDYYDGDWVDNNMCGMGIIKHRDGSFYEGYFDNNKYHGKGKLTYRETSNIDFYDGDWTYGKKSGFGIMRFKNGASYEGDWKEDNYHGRGKKIYKKESHVDYYEGDYENDKKNGVGIMRFKDGEKYEGEWKDDDYNGHGIFTYNKDKLVDYYEGQWLNNERHGSGKLFYKDGATWEGEWKNGKQYNGQGTIEYTDGCVFCGEIKDGKYHNKGKMTYGVSSNVDYYEGEWVDGTKKGQGIMVFKDGASYDGNWNGDSFNGYGVYTYIPNESLCEKYEGEWVNNEQCGFGTMHYLGGSYYEGQWKNGRYNGQGTFYNKSSLFRKKKKGYWKNGKYDLSNNKFIKWLYDLNSQVDQDQYIGDMKDGVYHGKGKLIDCFGEYEGDFVMGFRTGRGTQKYADGCFYDGEWDKNMMSGEGVLVLNTNITLKGIFENDELISGTITLPDGRASNVSDHIVENTDVYDELPKHEVKVNGLKRKDG